VWTKLEIALSRIDNFFGDGLSSLSFLFPPNVKHDVLDLSVLFTRKKPEKMFSGGKGRHCPKRGRGFEPPQRFGPATETYGQRRKPPQNTRNCRKPPQNAARRKTP